MRVLLLTLILGLAAGGVWLLSRSVAGSDSPAGAAPQAVSAPRLVGGARAEQGAAELEGAREQARAEAVRPSVALEAESGAGVEPASRGARNGAEVGWSARAVDSRGRPLAGVELRLVLVLSDEEQGREQVTTDSAGMFGFSELAQELPSEAWPPKVHVSRVSGAGQAWIAPLPMVTSGVRDLGDLILREAREEYPVPVAGGRVFGTDGAPVPGVRGSAFGANRYSSAKWVEEQPEEIVALYVGSEEWPVGELGQVLIEPDGRFVVHGPAGGLALRLRFTAPGYREADEWRVPLGALDLEVEMLRERRIRGRILVPEDGPPVNGYGIYAVDGENSVGIRLKPDGTFEVPAVEASQRIVLCYPMLGPELGSLALPPAVAQGAGEEVVVDFRNTIQLVRFQLLDESGEPRANARVSVVPEGEGLPGPMWGTFYVIRADEEGWMNLAFPLAYESVRLALLGEDANAALAAAEVYELSRLGDSVVLPN